MPTGRCPLVCTYLDEVKSHIQKMPGLYENESDYLTHLVERANHTNNDLTTQRLRCFLIIEKLQEDVLPSALGLEKVTKDAYAMFSGSDVHLPGDSAVVVDAEEEASTVEASLLLKRPIDRSWEGLGVLLQRLEQVEDHCVAYSVETKLTTGRDLGSVSRMVTDRMDLAATTLEHTKKLVTFFRKRLRGQPVDLWKVGKAFGGLAACVSVEKQTQYGLDLINVNVEHA